MIKTLFILMAASIAAFSQTPPSLASTTLSGNISDTQSSIVVTSATGINPGDIIVVEKEAMQVIKSYTPGQVRVQVMRGYAGTVARGHKSGRAVLAGRPSWFGGTNPSGTCSASSVPATPYVMVGGENTGNQWICSSVTSEWVPGWNNTTMPVGRSADVASGATSILPSGPFFQITGAAAITGFTIPPGFNGGSFTAVAAGAFTWTNTGNIAVAGAATTVGSTVTFTWDPVSVKWTPSRIQ